MIKITLPDRNGLHFSKLFARLYSETSEGFPRSYTGYPRELMPLIKLTAGHPVMMAGSCIIPRATVANDRLGVVGFSGGKDSLAAALKMRLQGVEPVLFHVAGINRAYPQEQAAVGRLAGLLGAEYVIFKIGHSGVMIFGSHPLKNQMILAFMVDFGVTAGAVHYVQGNFTSEVVANASRHFNFTDAVEVQQAANKFFAGAVGGYRGIDAILYAESESMAVINENLPTAFEHIESCMTGLRYKAGVRAANLRKFQRVPLLPGRCGSCYKCAGEYLHLVSFGIYPEDEAYTRHCLNIMRAWVPKLSTEKDVTIERAVSFFVVKDFVDISWLSKHISHD